MRLPATAFRNSTPSSIFVSLRRLFRMLACAAWGHRVDNRIFATDQRTSRKCLCETDFLQEDGSVTRVRHTLSCFFFGHHYTKMGERNGHCEFVCEICGHPLLFDSRQSKYARQNVFHKQVRYLCIVLGHRLHIVAERSGLTEYACHCGHSFLRHEKDRTDFWHPVVCVIKGHYISFFEWRNGYAQYRCRNCGHPFYFISAR